MAGGNDVDRSARRARRRGRQTRSAPVVSMDYSSNSVGANNGDDDGAAPNFAYQLGGVGLPSIAPGTSNVPPDGAVVAPSAYRPPSNVDLPAPSNDNTAMGFYMNLLMANNDTAGGSNDYPPSMNQLTNTAGGVYEPTSNYQLNTAGASNALTAGGGSGYALRGHDVVDNEVWQMQNLIASMPPGPSSMPMMAPPTTSTQLPPLPPALTPQAGCAAEDHWHLPCMPSMPLGRPLLTPMMAPTTSTQLPPLPPALTRQAGCTADQLSVEDYWSLQCMHPWAAGSSHAPPPAAPAQLGCGGDLLNAYFQSPNQASASGGRDYGHLQVAPSTSSHVGRRDDQEPSQYDSDEETSPAAASGADEAGAHDQDGDEGGDDNNLQMPLDRAAVKKLVREMVLSEMVLSMSAGSKRSCSYGSSHSSKKARGDNGEGTAAPPQGTGKEIDITHELIQSRFAEKSKKTFMSTLVNLDAPLRSGMRLVKSKSKSVSKSISKSLSKKKSGDS